MPHFYGAQGASNEGHYQWWPHSRRPLVLGSGRGSDLARLILHEMRWREPPREYALRITAWVLTLVLHLLVLLVLLLGRPSGYVPPGSELAQVTTVEVRLIEQPEPPPPPPPPIELPERKTAQHAKVPVPPTVKRAPVAAMPPVPVRAPTTPKVTLAPDKPRVAVTPPAPVAPHAAASPPTLELPEIAMPPPPEVVEELSARAMAPPPLQTVQVAPVKVPSQAMQPVPVPREAPVVTLGKSDLAMDVPAPSPIQPVTPAKVMAATPSLPSVNVTTPQVRVTPAPAPAPAIATPVQAPEVRAQASMPSVPLPQAPAVTVTPSLNLPTADVPVPQAPRVAAPDVRVEMPAAAATESPQTARATSSPRSSVPAMPPAKSWAPANDQFKPAGEANQPPQTAQAEPPGAQPGIVRLPPRGNSDVMTRESDHLGYKPTIFDQYWAPDNESILDTFLRHFIEKLSVKHTFHLAPGVRVHCVLGPMAVFLACGGDPPRPMSSKSGDARLNMAPARSLVPGLGTSVPAQASTVHVEKDVKCAVARVAGGPPPPGCPGAPPPPSKSDVWQ